MEELLAGKRPQVLGRLHGEEDNSRVTGAQVIRYGTCVASRRIRTIGRATGLILTCAGIIGLIDLPAQLVRWGGLLAPVGRALGPLSVGRVFSLMLVAVGIAISLIFFITLGIALTGGFTVVEPKDQPKADKPEP